MLVQVLPPEDLRPVALLQLTMTVTEARRFRRALDDLDRLDEETRDRRRARKTARSVSRALRAMIRDERVLREASDA